MARGGRDGETASHGQQRWGWQRDEAGHGPPGLSPALRFSPGTQPENWEQGAWGAARSGGMWGWAERVGEGAEGEGLGKDVCRRISAAL